ncbi:MAG: sigma-70 family RNA polymerase sigma factor [Chloroflexales bacterium]|nr:sigma-70 family RNA polymerase sigma factor [Chloroflexales bacterium]
MPSTEDLRELIGRAKTRDPGAISDLYGRYAGLVLRYIYIRVAEHELAQDLTQEVFIKIINGIERFEYRDEKAFLGWLYTIAANVLHSHQRRRRVVSTPFDTRDDLIDHRSQDDAHMITDRVALQQALEQLTRDQQQVLALRFFADMSNSEIAGILRRTEGAVKAIQHRALQSLQKILNREAEDPARPGGRSPSASGPTYQRQAVLSEREIGRPLVYTELSSSPLEAPGGD